MSIVVANELDGLRASKKEKTVRAAEDALAYVKSSGMRLLAVNGKILAGTNFNIKILWLFTSVKGGKSYALQTEDKKKNDELIMESAKKLHGGLLLTDDKNLLVRLKDNKCLTDWKVTSHDSFQIYSIFSDSSQNQLDPARNVESVSPVDWKGLIWLDK